MSSGESNEFGHPRLIVEGDTFEDLSERAGDRVVKVIEADPGRPTVRVECTVNVFRPKGVGRKYPIARTTLGDTTRFKRISH